MKTDRTLWLAAVALFVAGCVPELESPPREATTTLPASFDRAAPVTSAEGGVSSAELPAREFFADPHLVALIDQALENNQELNIAALEVFVTQSEILERKGEYLPKVALRGGGGPFREGEDETQIEDESDDGEYVLGLFASWELDIWGKLHDAKDAAVKRYLASIEGRRFLVTNLVAELSESYYELLALDNQLRVLEQNIGIQQEALEVVRLQKVAGRVSELAVKRFEAEVLKNQSRRYVIRQRIVETENQINFLVGRYPQPVARDATGFLEFTPDAVAQGVPSDLLLNRPDIQQAELALRAAELDVDVARKAFYPTLELNAGVAIEAIFELSDVPSSPISHAYHALAEISQPIWNRYALEADYYKANSRQMMSVFEYERTILRAFTEVATQLATVANLQSSYELRAQEVARLTESIAISSNLFRSARADYMEVLLTRRDALDAQMELIETKGEQLKARVKLYRALGGGWNEADPAP